MSRLSCVITTQSIQLTWLLQIKVLIWSLLHKCWVILVTSPSLGVFSMLPFMLTIATTWGPPWHPLCYFGDILMATPALFPPCIPVMCRDVGMLLFILVFDYFLVWRAHRLEWMTEITEYVEKACSCEYQEPAFQLMFFSFFRCYSTWHGIMWTWNQHRVFPQSFPLPGEAKSFLVLFLRHTQQCSGVKSGSVSGVILDSGQGCWGSNKANAPLHVLSLWTKRSKKHWFDHWLADAQPQKYGCCVSQGGSQSSQTALTISDGRSLPHSCSY